MVLEDWPKENIPSEHYVFRSVHCAKYKKWGSDRHPNEADFVLREGEDALSVNWEKYCSLQHVFILIGIRKNPKGEFRNPKEFKVIKFNVGDLRNLTISKENQVEVTHDPVIPDNRSHSLVLYNDDEEIRLKLCDLVSSLETPLLTIDMIEIEEVLRLERENII